MADEPFDRVLRRAVRRPTEAGACPDSSELAAFVENGLSREERALVEAHAAACERCAAELTALVRLPAPGTGGEAPAERDFFGWRWRWAIPLATAVVVFAVWSETSRESAPPAAPAAKVQPREQTPAAPPADDRDRLAGAGPSTSPRSPSSAPSAREAPAQAQRPDAATRAPAADHVRKQELGKQQPGKQELARQRSAPAAAADSIEESPQTFRDDMRPRGNTPPLAEPAGPSDREAEGDAAERRPAPEAFSAPDGAQSAAVRTEAALSSARPGQVPLIVRASDLVQVRVSGDRIERTSDGGVTWQTERAGLGAPLLTGACPAPDVCWLGGVRGRIVRRETSGRWVDVAIPADAPVAVIEAPDAMRATVTLADGRRFVTSDGGGSWSAAR